MGVILKRGDFVNELSKSEVDIRPHVARQLNRYIADHPTNEDTDLTPTGRALNIAMLKTGHVHRRSLLSEFVKSINDDKRVTDYFENIVKDWNRQDDPTKRRKPQLAVDVFIWFFLHVDDVSYFVEIARRTWARPSESFKRLIYAKCGGPKGNKFEGILARFKANFEEVEAWFRDNWPAEPKGAHMLPPPYVDEGYVKTVLNDDPTNGIWLNPYNHYTIKLSERKKEWNHLEAFIEDDRQFLIVPVIGPSGAGKTRLVSQWMKQYVPSFSPSDWDAGLVVSRDPKDWDEDHWDIQRDTLIIIDYVFAFDDVIKQLSDRARSEIKKNALSGSQGNKIRVVIIDHVLPKELFNDLVWKNAYRSRAIEEGYSSGEIFPELELKPQKDQSKLLRAVTSAVASLGVTKYSANDPKVIAAVATLWEMGEKNQSGNPNAIRHPLFAALLGQAIRDKKGFKNWTRKELVDYYFARDERLPWRVWSKQDNGYKLGLSVGALVSVSTLLRGIPFEVVPRVSPINTTTVGQLSNRVVSSSDERVLKPFEPDILGETFFFRFLEDTTADELMLQAFHETFEIVLELDTSKRYDFVGTFIRLIRNLLNEDQTTFGWFDPWDALVRTLSSSNFSTASQARVSITHAFLSASLLLFQIGKHDLAERFLAALDYVDIEALTKTDTWEVAKLLAAVYDSIDYVGGVLTDQLKEILLRTLGSVEADSTVPLSGLGIAALTSSPLVAKLLIENGSKINEVEPISGESPLLIASELGAHSFAHFLLENDADPEQENPIDGRFPLIIAAQQGHLRTVNLLLSYGALPEREHPTGGCPLHLAAQLGHAPVVKVLLEAKVCPNQVGIKKNPSPLQLASNNGHSEVVRILLSYDADPDQKNEMSGAFPLLVASFSGHSDVVDLLTNAGANPDQKNEKDGLFPLLLASQEGHYAVVSRLLEAKADPNKINKEAGTFSLLQAAQEGHTEIVLELLSALADPNRVNPVNGCNPIQIASEEGHNEVVMALGRYQVDPNQENPFDGTSALQLACIKGFPDVVYGLVKLGADLLRVNMKNGYFPLLSASEHGHTSTVEALLNRRASSCQVNFRDGTFPLILAVNNGHHEVAEMLVRGGADPHQLHFMTGITPSDLSQNDPKMMAALGIGPQAK